MELSKTMSEPKANTRELGMLLALCAVATYFYLANPTFLSPRNLSQLAIELSATAVLGLGMLLIILPGHIDLSVGSGLGLFGAVAAVLIFNYGWSAPSALLIATLAATLTYFLMGWVIVEERVPAFIITLGGLLVFKGLHWLVIDSHTIPVTVGGEDNLYSLLTTSYLSPRVGYATVLIASLIIGNAAWTDLRRRRAQDLPTNGELTFLKWFAASQALLLVTVVMNAYQGVPMALLLLGLTAAGVYVLTTHTRFGRYLYAIGGNERASVIAGIPTGRTVKLAFAMIGVVVALAGFLQTAFAGASTTTTGQLMELDAIAACVIGGTSLRGGRGTVVGVLFGAVIMAVLLNGMTLLAVTPERKFIARGLVLALAVWMDVRLSRRRGERT